MKQNPKTKYPPLGSTIKIVEPYMFLRCGYPLTLEDVRGRYRDQITEKVNKVISVIDDISPHDNYFIHKLETAFASDIIRKLGWGGDERKVYEQSLGTIYEDARFTLKAKTMVYEGKRHSGYSHYDSQNGDYDGHPTFFQTRRGHCVYTLDCVEDKKVKGLKVLASRCELVAMTGVTAIPLDSLTFNSATNMNVISYP